MVELFKIHLDKQGKSSNTVQSYGQHVKGYIEWFETTKQMEFSKLHEENVREFIHHLKQKKQKPSTINAKLNALSSFNEFLVAVSIQSHTVAFDSMYQKVQQQYASLATLELQDVERFRQVVLEEGSKRNYCLVTLLAYAGLRISEALNLKLNDIRIGTREIDVKGKGNKDRVVLMNGKVKDALEVYLRERDSESPYLFYSRQNDQLNRTTVNNIFRKYTHPTPNKEAYMEGFSLSNFSSIFTNPSYPYSNSNSNSNSNTNSHSHSHSQSIYTLPSITPHDLRHFYCSYALSIGMSIAEVANQAGHSSVQTTLLYTNPTKQQMLDKLDKM